MTHLLRSLLALAVALPISMTTFSAPAADAGYESELLAIQHEWAAANYGTADKKARRAAFDALVAHSGEFAARHPDQVEAVAWDGIVLSTYAGEVSAMGAMKVAKAALAQLLAAERLEASALAGGVYASLGALYSKVPGGFVGFGDDALARQYFDKALAVDAGNMDNNFFYGEFLIDQGEYQRALELLRRALAAPIAANRPVFDAGRRAEIRSLIAEAEAAAS